VNKQITRLAAVSTVLLAILIAATTYWQTWAAPGLAARQDNAVKRVAQFTVKRGTIVASDGTRLAWNVRKRIKGQTFYFREYPHDGLFAQTVGYATQGRSRSGIERELNAELTGSDTNLNSVWRRTVDQVKGITLTGNDLRLSLKPGPQRTALQALGDKCGAVAAIEPKTGKVLVLASSPTYDQNLVENKFAQIEKVRAECSPAAPLVNRATDGLYIPGSTFKVVTSSAALKSGKYKLSSTFQDPGYCIEYGKKVLNYADQSGPEQFGTVNFTTALEHSINAVFCEIGKALGPKPIVEEMEDYGFYERPPIETPATERSPSGLYRNGHLFKPKDAGEVDPGRLAFGQERLLVTPLQMAMVAGGVANNGVVMDPYLVETIRSPSGALVSRTKPRQLHKALEPQVAADVASMMEAVVKSGTGTAAQIPGVRVAGKTGTAETGVDRVNTVWFIAFAPVDDPKVAIAVVVEKQRGTGGQWAAPIAKQVMQAILGRGSNS
jgi:peptidoglycan glycosyltransferase